MAVVTEVSKQERVGNSSATVFTFDFRILKNPDTGNPYLDLYLADSDYKSTTEAELLAIDTDYSITSISDISFVVNYPLTGDPLPSTKRLIAVRNTPLTQEFFTTTTPERKPIENIADRLTLAIQDLNDKVERAVRLPVTADPDTDIESILSDQLIEIKTLAVSTKGYAEEMVETTQEAIALAQESSHAHLNKSVLDEFGTTGSSELTFNGDMVAFVADLSVMVQTNATNADAESFRSLVGMPEVESNITGLQTEVASTGSNVAAIASRVTVLENDDVQALCYAPQTIVAGATGDLPDGWTLEDCDAPAAHIYSSGTSELTIVAGLQVAAGYEGQVYLSDALAADTTLDISDLISGTDGTGYIYSNIGTDGSQSFGYTENQPQVGIQKNDYSDFVPTLSANTDKGFIVSISSSYSTEYPPYKGYDGVTTQNTGVITSSSAYSSLIGNESMYIELESGEAFETNGIMLMPYAVSSVLYGMPANFTIDGSDDGGENWANIFRATDITGWKLQTYKRFNWDKVSYKKYRINCTKLAFSTYFALTEIKWLQPLSCDFFNIAKQTHYDANGNAIRRVYIGSVTVTNGVIEEIINFQHGTEYTEIINDYKNVTINAIYYPKKRYLGSCYPTARVYVESHWGRTGFFCYSGFSAGVRVWSTGESLSVHTAITYLTHVRSTNLATFMTYVTSAPCKITVKRGY